MPRWTLSLAAAALLLTCPALGKDLPAPPLSRVYNEGVLRGLDAQYLGQTLRELHDRTGHEMFVALFQSLDGEDIDAYANRLFKAWKPGSARADDGLLLCLFVRDRKWRVEVGYGLEGSLTDLEANAIVERSLPALRAGDYDGGINAIVDALGRRLATVPSRETTWEKRLLLWRELWAEYGIVLILFPVLVPALLGLLLYFLWLAWRNRRVLGQGRDLPAAGDGSGWNSSADAAPEPSAGGPDGPASLGGGGGDSGGAGAGGSW